MLHPEPIPSLVFGWSVDSFCSGGTETKGRITETKTEPDRLLGYFPPN